MTFSTKLPDPTELQAPGSAAGAGEERRQVKSDGQKLDGIFLCALEIISWGANPV